MELAQVQKHRAENSGIIHKPVLKIKRTPNEDVK